MKPFVITKQLAIAIFAVLVLTAGLSACGGSSTTNPTSVTGAWTVTLLNSSNVATYVFTTTLNQQDPSPSISSPVTGSDFNLTSTDAAQPSSCFSGDKSAKQTGVFTVTDNFNGLTVSTLQLTVQGATGTINMRGTFATNKISGPWTLETQAPGCSLGGTFLMTR